LRYAPGTVYEKVASGEIRACEPVTAGERDQDSGPRTRPLPVSASPRENPPVDVDGELARRPKAG
jgi:hypothetical protein